MSCRDLKGEEWEKVKRVGGDSPAPMVEEEEDAGFFVGLGRTVSELITKQYFRTAVNVQHKTLEDFGRIERVLRRSSGGWGAKASAGAFGGGGGGRARRADVDDASRSRSLSGQSCGGSW